MKKFKCVVLVAAAVIVAYDLGGAFQRTKMVKHILNQTESN